MGAKGLAALVAVVGLWAGMAPAAWPQEQGPENGRIYYDNGDGIASVMPDGSGFRRIVDGASTPSVSPDGRRLAYYFGEGVWVADADGSDARQITPDWLSASDPSWSPDGRRLVFVGTGETGYIDVWVGDADGTNLVNLTPGSPFHDSDPVWSPDGTRVAFVSDRFGPFQLLTVSAAGGDQTPRRLTFSGSWSQFPDWAPADRIAFMTGGGISTITDNAEAEPQPLVDNGAHPAWSPDGARIVFVRSGNLWTSDGGPPSRVTSSEFDGAQIPDWSTVDDLPDTDADTWSDGNDNCPEDPNQDQLDSDGDGVGDACVEQSDGDDDGIADRDDNCPSVSNKDQSDGDGDGTGDLCEPVGRIYYVEGGVPGEQQIVSVLPDGSERRVITRGLAPTIDPSGQRVAYQADRGVWLADADGSDATRLTPPEVSAALPAWSPSGDRLAYVQETPGGGMDVWVTAAGLGSPVNLTAGSAAYDAEPAWSPDGQSIIFTSNRDGFLQLYRVPAHGDGQPARLTFTEGEPTQYADWHPSGRQIAYMQSDREIRTLFLGGVAAEDTQYKFQGGEYAFQEGGLQTVGIEGRFPAWSPDGTQLAFGRADDLWVQPADGEQRALTSSKAGAQYVDWTAVTDLPDRDQDTLADGNDNCPGAANLDQQDTGGTRAGDACEDRDADTVVDAGDNCVEAPNAGQEDTGGTRAGDACEDRDDDTILDAADNCEDLANQDQADLDEDGRGDACDGDRDGDEVVNNADNCPDTENGDQRDTDGDESGDACDGDRDGDDHSNMDDNCPDDANQDQADLDKDGEGDACDGDRDGDNVDNATDNCADVANPGQRDLDRDKLGDPCDPDADDDGRANESDNCAYTVNRGQADRDNDGVGDACELDRDEDGIADDDDNCVSTPNADQADADADGVGDACDPDRDGDGVANAGDNCADVANKDQEDLDLDKIGDACDGDRDGDRIGNRSDNCPTTANFDQSDGDGDGLGDACDPQTTPPAAQQPSGGTAGFQQGTQEPPPPQVGESVTVRPVRGKVYVRRPGQPPRELKEGETIPVGSIVDTRAGVVTLISAVPGGGRDTADFYDGIFQVLQDKTGLTELRLTEKLTCGNGKSTRGSSRGRSRAAAGTQKRRRLWGHGKGSFRTRGNYSAATVRGTWWLVEDTCASTITSVREGLVVVRDFVSRQTVLVRAGERYVARRR